MAICTHWEGKGVGGDGREKEGNTDKGKEGLASWRHKAFPQTI